VSIQKLPKNTRDNFRDETRLFPKVLLINSGQKNPEIFHGKDFSIDKIVRISERFIVNQ
jgi:hypothetical protein